MNSKHLGRLLKSTTPAAVFDERAILDSLESLKSITTNRRCYTLYSVKACSFVPILEIIGKKVDGFSCSSSNELQLASNVSTSTQKKHCVSPAISEEFLSRLDVLPDLLTLNSIQQFSHVCSKVDSQTSLGIRANPKTRFVKSRKYDPCRVGSKLGVSIATIDLELRGNEEFCDLLEGLHVHNNCESEDFRELQQTVEILKPLLRKHPFKWINLGGGYQIDDVDPEPFLKTVEGLVEEFDLDVYFEPGNGIVRDAGFLVTTVVDLFNSDDTEVAVLDTTVNHAPEVFEYDWSPPVLGSCPDGKFKYLLAGCSCLAGDVFGEYQFEKPLQVGQKLIFESLGAYAMPKWSYFNGINLPNIYVLTRDGELDLRKSYTFEDFADRCGVSKIVAD